MGPGQERAGGLKPTATFGQVAQMLQGFYEDIYPRFVRTRLAGVRAGDGVGPHLSLKFELEAIQEIRDELKLIEGLLPESAVMEEEQREALTDFLRERIGRFTERIVTGDYPIDDPSGSLKCLVSERGIYQKILEAFE